MPTFVNPFHLPGQWYKANLHCHTSVSDGHFTPKQRVEQYGSRGYSILAITDHRTTVDVAALSTKELMVVSGIECHPACPGSSNYYHLVGLNVPHPTAFTDDVPANEVVAGIRRLGGEVILGHAYWCGQNINHLMNLKGYLGLEVFNSVCYMRGRGYASTVWDDLSQAGVFMPAVAVDDSHRPEEFFFLGWTNFKMPELTVEAFMHALRTGAFYSSCGPEIHDFGISQDGSSVFVKCSPVKEIHFMATAPGGISVYTAEGQTVTEGKNRVQAGWTYVRAEVVDERGRRAWTNPILLGEGAGAGKAKG